MHRLHTSSRITTCAEADCAMNMFCFVYAGGGLTFSSRCVTHTPQATLSSESTHHSYMHESQEIAQ
ncbi:hypothetical protein BDZ97DRAFT_1790591 [Flammula alnicola]|nr:hypothetical protein BDZ97DRAFT_1790591 [Flammula alnicola]